LLPPDALFACGDPSAFSPASFSLLHGFVFATFSSDANLGFYGPGLIIFSFSSPCLPEFCSMQLSNPFPDARC